MEKLSAEIVKRKRLTRDLEIVWLKPSEKFEWQPGQYCTIGHEGTERPYSIASAPHEGLIELFLELVPPELQTQKSLTPKLLKLDIGSCVDLRPKAKGKFLLDEVCETRVMIATVTGVAPFISMIRAQDHGYYSPCTKPIFVFQGASYVDEFGYDEELREAEKAGHITYVPTISRPDEERNKGWQGQVGRVNVIVEEQFKKFNIEAQHAAVYLCGHKGMVDYLGNPKEKPDIPLGTLVKQGFDIRSEVYF